MRNSSAAFGPVKPAKKFGHYWRRQRRAGERTESGFDRDVAEKDVNRGLRAMTTQTTDGLAPRDGIPPSASSSRSSSTETVSVCESLRRTVRVRNPLGLHQRAADRFVRAA